MTTSLTRPCAHHGCRRTTTDPTGRCHDHRDSLAPGASTAVVPLPVPAVVLAKEWVSGVGMIHPTGGYDEVIFDVSEQTDEDDFYPGEELVFATETTSYFLGEKLHRLDGPARETVSGYRPGKLDPDEDEPEFYIEGELYEPAEFEKITEALAGGAPLEWAIAYAQGGTDTGAAAGR